MCRPADGRVDRAVEGFLGDAHGAIPPLGVGPAIERTIAGESELAPRLARRTLIHHAANAGRKSRMANAIQDHLGDRSLAISVLVPGFVVNGAGKAFERLGPCASAALEHERSCDRVGSSGKRYC